jgi:hypothetical protein
MRIWKPLTAKLGPAFRVAIKINQHDPGAETRRVVIALHARPQVRLAEGDVHCGDFTPKVLNDTPRHRIVRDAFDSSGDSRNDPPHGP